MNCPRCQTYNADQANFCNHCGTMLRDANGPSAYNPFAFPQAQQPDKSATFLMILLSWELVLAIFQALGLYVFMHMLTPTPSNISGFYKIFNVTSFVITTGMLIGFAVAINNQRTRIFLLVYLALHVLISGYYLLTSFSSHF